MTMDTVQLGRVEHIITGYNHRTFCGLGYLGFRRRQVPTCLACIVLELRERAIQRWA